MKTGFFVGLIRHYVGPILVPTESTLHTTNMDERALCPCPPAAPCSKKKLLLNFLSHEKKAITNVVIAMFICCDADIHGNCML